MEWKKPCVNHFRIFGCVAYAHIPDEKRKKLDDKGEKCVFFSVSDQSKAYKLYNPNTKKIVSSRDDVFDEVFWEWNGKAATIDHSVVSDFEEVNENLSTDSSEDTQHRVPITYEIDEQSSEPVSSRSHRVRRRPTRMSDYEVIGVSESFLTHFALFSDCDPTTFENAVKDSKMAQGHG